MQEILLQVKGLNCRLARNRTLRIASFTLALGEHWCVFGGNGSGKTALARLLTGSFPACRAALSYQAGLHPARDIALVSFEEQRRLWELDDRHDISEFSDAARDQGTTVKALILGDDAADISADSYYHRLLWSLNLAQQEHQGIRFLSSGQVRKAMIAQALYRNPRILILDDPLESIDRESREGIARVLHDWRSDGNSSIVLSRRQGDMPESSTHLALMHELSMPGSGEFAHIRNSVEFQRLFNTVPLIPAALPAAIPGLSAAFAGDGNQALIELRDVGAAWQSQPVLESINWTLRPGQHALIEGPNGSGKSTLLSLINGENHKAYGQHVRLFGRRRGSGETVWQVKAQFGLVSNELHNRYIRGWRVLEVVVSGFYDSLGLYDDAGASEQLAARNWLRAVGLQGQEREHYHELSFGQQRLVLLARAMVKQPRILILDEPCVGLDDHHQALILAILDRIAGQGHTQLIYVTHTPGEHPRCINQFLRLIPVRLPPDAAGHESIHSRTPHTLEIREVPPSP